MFVARRVLEQTRTIRSGSMRTRCWRSTPDDLAAGFQVTADNPLVGLEGRAALLNRLGRTVAINPDIFGAA